MILVAWNKGTPFEDRVPQTFESISEHCPTKSPHTLAIETLCLLPLGMIAFRHLAEFKLVSRAKENAFASKSYLNVVLDRK